MISRVTILFLVFAAAFAGTHAVALAGSLYWYHWWFDIMMHFWGGILIGMGVHVLGTFGRLHLRPTFKIVFLILLALTFSWEVFEWHIGIDQPGSYWLDTTIDVLLGFSGGLLAHTFLRRGTMKQS